MSRTTLCTFLAAAAAVLAACDDAPSAAPIHFSDLVDGAYLGGAQRTTFEVDAPVAVRSAELYLDGLRIATDELAPFELGWDTRDFAEGAHELRVRALLDDESDLDAAIAVHIDNTVPRLVDVPTTATTGETFVVAASDNELLDRVEITRVDHDESEQPITLRVAPFAFRWEFGCGSTLLNVRAVDAAGLYVQRIVEVWAGAPDDADCDGATWPADCNDADATIHPGAEEGFDGIDHDCNGIAGADEPDRDHDGVPNRAHGGDDCNDHDPDIHGVFYTPTTVPLAAAATPFTWSPGQAVLSYSDTAGRVLVVRNRGGVVDALRGDTVEAIATGANPGSIAADGAFVAFGRGADVVIEAHGASGWHVGSTLHAEAPVGVLAVLDGRNGALHAVTYQSGTHVYLATSPDLEIWSTEDLVDAGAALAEAPSLSFTGLGLGIAFRTATAAWRAEKSGASPPVVTPLGVDGEVPLAVGATYGYTVVAVTEGTGSALYHVGFGQLASFPSRVVALAGDSDILLVRLEDGDTRVLRASEHFAQVQVLTTLPPWDAHLGTTLATSARTIYLVTPPVVDTRGDGVDADCDGFDD